MAMSSDNALRVFDADNHYYEALDAFTRHLDPRHGPRVAQWAEVHGRQYLVIGGRVDYSVSNPTFDPIAKPGALMDWFRVNAAGVTVEEALSEREPIPAAYRNRDARLQVMDEQGLEQAWFFPTLGCLYEEQLKDDIEAVGLLFDAFNRWLEEDWGFAYQDRIFAAPYIPLGDVDTACEMLRWALDRDARLIVMRPAAVHTIRGAIAPTHPHFDRFWSMVAEAGITVVVHASASGHTHHGYTSDTYSTGFDDPHRSIWYGLHQERPIFDFLASLLVERFFERYPTIRVASIENGARFLDELVAKMSSIKRRHAAMFKEDPVELLRNNVWIAPFWEDDVNEVLNVMGPDRVLFGSDWPHVEGLVQPLDYLGEIAHLAPDVQAKILGDNVRYLNQPSRQPVG